MWWGGKGDLVTEPDFCSASLVSHSAVPHFRSRIAPGSSPSSLRVVPTEESHSRALRFLVPIYKNEAITLTSQAEVPWGGITVHRCFEMTRWKAFWSSVLPPAGCFSSALGFPASHTPPKSLFWGEECATLMKELSTGPALRAENTMLPLDYVELHFRLTERAEWRGQAGAGLEVKWGEASKSTMPTESQAHVEKGFQKSLSPSTYALMRLATSLQCVEAFGWNRKGCEVFKSQATEMILNLALSLPRMPSFLQSSRATHRHPARPRSSSSKARTKGTISSQKSHDSMCRNSTPEMHVLWLLSNSFRLKRDPWTISISISSQTERDDEIREILTGQWSLNTQGDEHRLWSQAHSLNPSSTTY